MPIYLQPQKPMGPEPSSWAESAGKKIKTGSGGWDSGFLSEHGPKVGSIFVRPNHVP
ncbi:hypothetical protein CC79DRAFT_1335546 [Sarocladium strictum]